MTFVDMFCGMGTIRMGFEQAGHECVYSVEFDKHKRKIYEVIFGHEPDASDIRTVRGSDIPVSDCWCFGAPCQDFSVAGLRAGLDGERSGLVREVFRLVREKEPADRPEWLLYENVKGMLSSNNGWDFAAIQAEMGELGYDVQWQLLNSKNFGVPQNRERVYTLGHLRARGERKVFSITPTNGKNPVEINILAHREGFRRNLQTYATSSITEALDCAQGGGRVMCVGGIYTNCSPGYDRGPLPGISRTLKADGGHPCGVTNGKWSRFLTPREYMRLQGVPDYITDKLIAAGISDTQMYRAAGDACTVNVIYEIAHAMAEQWAGMKGRDENV